MNFMVEMGKQTSKISRENAIISCNDFLGKWDKMNIYHWNWFVLANIPFSTWFSSTDNIFHCLVTVIKVDAQQQMLNHFLQHNRYISINQLHFITLQNLFRSQRTNERTVSCGLFNVNAFHGSGKVWQFLEKLYATTLRAVQLCE